MLNKPLPENGLKESEVEYDNDASAATACTGRETEDNGHANAGLEAEDQANPTKKKRKKR